MNESKMDQYENRVNDANKIRLLKSAIFKYTKFYVKGNIQ